MVLSVRTRCKRRTGHSPRDHGAKNTNVNTTWLIKVRIRAGTQRRGHNSKNTNKGHAAVAITTRTRTGDTDFGS